MKGKLLYFIDSDTSIWKYLICDYKKDYFQTLPEALEKIEKDFGITNECFDFAISKNASIFKEYWITSQPTFVIEDQNGNEVDRAVWTRDIYTYVKEFVK